MLTFEPTSIALVGASGEEKKLGYELLKNLTTWSYKGKIYPVNPKRTELLGLPCFASVDAIPGTVDMVVIATPAVTVPDILKSCAKKKVKTVVVISAGFGELNTDEGHRREVELKKIAEEHNLSIIGPNCLGILRPPLGLNASFAVNPKRDGNVALVSQSGAMAVALLDQAEELKLGFSLVASIGNKTVEDESSILEWLQEDEATSVIGLYLESIKDGQRFVAAAKKLALTKPIVLIKAGTSKRGAKAVASHTGALAGSTASLDAACQSAGIKRVETTDEFLATLSALSSEPPLLTKSIAIITNAGGPGVLATDACEREGLELAALSDTTKAALKKALPEAASNANPVDVLGDAQDDRYKAAIELLAKDPEVDGIVTLLTPQVMTPADKIAKAVLDIRKKHPMIPIVASFMGGEHVAAAKELLRDGGVPCLDTPEQAIRTMAGLAVLPTEDEATESDTADAVRVAAKQLLKQVSGFISESITQDLFELYNLPVPSQALATSADEAATIAQQIGFPVIAKVSSPDILHKTESGGLRANLTSAAEVKKAYKEIIEECKKKMPAAAIRGVLIQQFLPAGSEFIVGGIRDDVFGPLVMVGLGGIYTELFKDTCFRLAPVSSETAYVMLQSLKASKLLHGMRGKDPLDIDALADLIVTISKMMDDCPEIAELDLNPVLVKNKGVTIADAKIVVKKVTVRPE